MTITERQKNILDELVREYIDTAKPVSSEIIEEAGFDVCPATIRNEMKKLADMGYLSQPHTSSGRVPTNKAYRFFVDEIFESDENPETLSDKRLIKELENLRKLENERIKMAENIAKMLGRLTSGLAFAYLSNEDFVLKDGWGDVFKNPEFDERGYLDEFVSTAENFENNLRDFWSDAFEAAPSVYIGREKSILNSTDFSIIASKLTFGDDDEGVVAILGPTRMAYDKNIELISLILKQTNNF